MVQKLHLLRRRFHTLAVHDQLECIQIDDELVEHQTALFLLARLLLGRAAQNSLHARKHLLHLEGLCDVVVRALLEARDLVARLALCGQHDDGHLGVLTDGAQHAPAVHDRQHQVEQDKIRTESAELVDALAAVVCDDGLIALVLEIELEQLGNIVVVLDDQDLFGHGRSLLCIVSGTKVRALVYTEIIINHRAPDT